MQKASFDYEIIIGEDDSSDNTRAICIEYAKKYPKKIRLLLNARENNIAVRNKQSNRFNYFYIWYSARGKYIAICDGDDYWTSENKLDKQVSFLEKNDDYGFSIHRSAVLYEDSKLLNPDTVYKHKNSFNLKDFIKYNIAPRRSMSVDYKKELVEDHFPSQWILTKAFGIDWTISLFASLNKRIHYIHQTLGIYRVHSNGIWSGNLASVNAANQIWYRSFLIKHVFDGNRRIQNLLKESLLRLRLSRIRSLIFEKNYKTAKNQFNKINLFNVLIQGELKDKIFFLKLRIKLILQNISL